SGMGVSSVLFEGAFHPAPGVGPSPAALKGDRFHDISIRGGAVLEADEIAAGTIEFFALGQADCMPLPRLGAIEREAVLHGLIDCLRCPFVSHGVVVSTEKFDREVSQERMNAVDTGLGPAEFDIVVRQILSEKNRGNPVRASNRLKDLVR